MLFSFYRRMASLGLGKPDGCLDGTIDYRGLGVKLRQARGLVTNS